MPALTKVKPEQSRLDQDPVRLQIRGSSLFLFGRFISLGINFATQVLIIRFLSTTDYGALAYGLAMASFLRLLSTMGLHDAVSRFVPIYRERGEKEKLLGTVLLGAGVVFFTGILMMIPVLLGLLNGFLTRDPLALQLLGIVIFLVPIEAIDCVLDSFFASFAEMGNIFRRKYLLGPCLTLTVVAVLIAGHQSVRSLAFGYVLAYAAAESFYVWMLCRLLRRQGFFEHFSFGKIQLPAKEVLAYAAPGISAILATAGIPSINILLLGHLRSMADVAYYRAAIPLAELNGVGVASFGLLYLPSLARLFARSDMAGMSRLYWRTAAWMSVLSFPIFAMTFCLAKPVVVTLYGARYAPTAPVLAWLALASYFNVLLGFNLQTLKVFEKLRYITIASICSIGANIILGLLLIPRLGAIGAAICAAVSFVMYKVVLQAGLRPAKKFEVFDRQCLSIYATICAATAVLFAAGKFASLNLYAALALTAFVSLIVIAVTREKLQIKDAFPELSNVPVLRMILP